MSHDHDHTPPGLRVLPSPNACRLPSELLPTRLAHVAEVLRSDLVRSDLQDGVLALEFHRSIERVRDLATLVAEESECCAFLGVDLQIPQGGDTITLRIRAPSDAQDLLRSFASAAERAGEAP